MARVWLARAARRDADAIRQWLGSQAGPGAAAGVLARILRSAELHASQPEAGKIVPELGPACRRYVVAPYLVFYRVTQGGIELLRIVDGRRDVPKILQAPDDLDA